ncbi:MAG TPA: hypothetical protein VF933_30000, partial [Streptosporangiaceae bacterium]
MLGCQTAGIGATPVQGSGEAGHNTQPGWYSASGQEISLHADAGRQLMVADPQPRDDDQLRCRAAYCQARPAVTPLHSRGLRLPDPAQPLLVAHVSWQRQAAPTEHEQRHFNQVLRR